MDTERPTSRAFEGATEAEQDLIRRLTVRVELAAREDYELRLLSTELKARQSKLERAKAALATDMAAAGMKNFKTASGLQPSITEKKKYFVPSQDDPRLLEFADTLGWGRMIQRVVPFQSVQHICLEAEKKGIALPEWIQVNTTPSIRLGGKTQFARRQHDNGTGETDGI